MYPEAVMFVVETLAPIVVEVIYLFPFASKILLPVTCNEPERVAFVPETFVVVKVPIVELGVRSSVVDATPPARTENRVRDASWMLM